jgi:hypothetical protein
MDAGTRPEGKAKAALKMLVRYPASLDIKPRPQTATLTTTTAQRASRKLGAGYKLKVSSR